MKQLVFGFALAAAASAAAADLTIGVDEAQTLSGEQSFDRIFCKFRDSVLIVSYSSNSLPTKDEMVAMMAKYKAHVEVVPIDYRYNFGNRSDGKTKRDVVQEYIFLGY